ncbi:MULTISPECIES: acyltransferase [Nocardiaceae]|uniref:Acyltransferase n=1 Tax=Rhodococcoides kroppenstedtii TaxID=293050 RepID=A0ABS7NW12_9NOCA|nr:MULTISPECIES: acyltransferase [Rhodococcus]AMY20477.1 Putative acetyltransferase [Rhodococcus sp. PBTS 1]MBY6314329.1 acyltransferase [Rhodococcus kroppenstedtii]MBY6322228.1 acyltransferase [Rhodococcus kroppenstedtii]MBY6401023.1 acyltransferase [Rhodococcus kroppenstedtii]
MNGDLLVRTIALVLIRKTGRDVKLDPNLSSLQIAAEVSRRSVAMFRGMVTLCGPVFRGRGVRLRARRNLSFGRGASIGDFTVIDARASRPVEIGSASKLGRYGLVTTTSSLALVGVGFKMGERSGIGDFFHIGCSGGVDIGDDVIAGPFLTVHSQEHRYSDVSTKIRAQGTVESSVTVMDDCWLGSRVTILAGTTIRGHTVVASGSVVKGDFPPNVVLGGVPARILKTLD